MSKKIVYIEGIIERFVISPVAYVFMLLHETALLLKILYLEYLLELDSKSRQHYGDYVDPSLWGSSDIIRDLDKSISEKSAKLSNCRARWCRLKESRERLFTYIVEGW